MSNTEGDPPRVVVPRYIEYFEAGVFTICSLYSLITLINYAQLAPRAARLYPNPGGVVFLALLFIGGATGLASYAMKTIMGLRVELASLTLLVTLCVAYSLWTLFAVGWSGVGLLLWMGIMIAVPGFFTRRRLAKYIKSLERMNKVQGVGEREDLGNDTAGNSPRASGDGGSG